MRFFAAVAATLAVGAIAQGTADEEVVTVQVTEYTTYCPVAASSAAAAAASSAAASVSTTVSEGVTYTLSRPLITSTVTRCNSCSSSAPLIHTPYPSSSAVFVSSAVASSAPSAPSGAGATTGSATTPAAAPVFTGGASRVAGAGAGLAAVFALAAYLL